MTHDHIEMAMLRDRLLDWLFDSCPDFMHDEQLLNGLWNLLRLEVLMAVGKERERLLRREPSKN